jgi:uncharacterized protein
MAFDPMSREQNPLPPSESHQQANALGAASDLVLIIGTLMAVKTALLQFDSLWTYAGPISLLAAFGVASLCLYRNKERWADLGLRAPPSYPKMLGWSVVVLIVTMIVGILVNAAINAALVNPSAGTDARYGDRFADLPGNTPAFLYWVVVSWVIGAFVEEMLFRAMLISRFERLFPRSTYAAIIAIILQALLFGQQHHYYQGLSGALATGALALISGAFYIGLKRNLWSLILSHGAANMIGLSLIYGGIQPPG